MRWQAALAAIAVVVALPAAATTPPSTSPPPTERLSLAAFRDRMAAAIKVQRPAATITVVDDRTLKVTERGRTDLTFNLDNAFAQYRDVPDDIDAIIGKYARVLFAASGDNDGATVDQLVVIVRPTDYLRASGAPADDDLVAPRPMAGDRSYFLAVDATETIRTASRGDLARWRLDADAAWTRAVANLHARMGPIAQGPLAGVDDSPDAIGAASGLAPSLLADPAFCGPAAPNGIRGQVVLVLNKEAFMFGLSDDPDSMRRFTAAARTIVEEAERFSRTPLACRGGHWTAIPVP